MSFLVLIGSQSQSGLLGSLIILARVYVGGKSFVFLDEVDDFFLLAINLLYILLIP